MWSRSELKTNAKAALKNYFWKGFLAIVIVGALGSVASWLVQTIVTLITGVDMSATNQTLVQVQEGVNGAQVSTDVPEGYTAATSIIGILNLVISVFFLYPLTVGLNRFFEKSRGVKTGIGEIFVPLKKCIHVGLVMLWMGIKVFLWSLLLIIPGIIKAYEYSMVPYILAENPEISGKRAFQISKAMTKGHKWNLFVLELSFILWIIGTVCTCGLLGIYLAPYMQATMTEAYYKLKAEAVANGGATLQELPDICLPNTALPFDNAASAPAAASDTTSNVATAAAAAAVATAAADCTAAEAPVEAVEEAVEAPVEAVEEAAETAEEAVADAVEAPAEAVADAVETVEEAAETPAE